MDKHKIYDATNEEKDYITRQLIKFNHINLRFKQEPASLRISRCIRNGNEVIGGILAEVYWGVVFIDILWVNEEYRNKGYASALLSDVENTAKENNCNLCHLDTFDFQARDFYEKHGYTVFGVLEDCPEGHNRFYMSKKLV